MESNEEVKTEEVEDTTPDIGGLLSAFPGAPDKEAIESWKQVHGEVLCSGFSDTELFIWRPLSRREFVAFQVEAAQTEQGMNQLDAEEKTVNACVLWASDLGQKALEIKAGSLSTLHEQIMQNSNFVNPAMASALVIRL